MRKIFSVALIFISIFFLSKISYAEDSLYNESVYTINNGLLSSQTLDIVQTNDGYIWIAGYNGLTRYDSKSFKNYTSDTGFPSKDSTSVIEFNNELFIGTQTAGIYYMEDNEFINIKSPTTSNYIKSMAICRNRLFVGTNKGIFYIDSEYNTYNIEEFSDICVNNLYSYNNTLYIVDNSESIKSWDNNTITDLYNGTGIFIDGESTWVANSNNTIDCYINDVKTTYECKNSVIAFSKTKDNTLYVGGDDGVAYFDGSKFVNITTDVSTSIEKIIEDYEGNIWISSSRQGISRLEVKSIVNETIKYSAFSSSVNAVIEYKGDIYVGSDMDEGSDTLRVIRDSNLITNPLTEAVGALRVRALAIDSNDNLWVGCYGSVDKPLIKYDGNTVTLYTADDIKSNKVRCLYNYNDRLYVGIDSYDSNQAGIFYIENNTMSNVVNTPYRPLCLYACSDGLYVGTDGGGVLKINNDFNSYENMFESLEDKSILRITGYLGGLLISYSSCLYYYKDNSLIEINSIPFQTSIFDLIHHDNYLWILSSSTIYKIKDEDFLSDNLDYLSLNYLDGLNCDVTANSWSSIIDGILFICGGDGLYSLNTNHEKSILSSIKIDLDQIYSPNNNFSNDKIQLGKNVSRISIDLKVLLFSNKKDIYISYQLVGQDSDEIIVKYEDLNVITYTNLNGGNYKFNVKILDSKGNIISSYNNILEIEKEYKIYEYGWYLPVVISLAIIIFSIIFLIFYFYRINKLKAKNRENVNLTYQTIIMMAKIIDAKDPYTRGHSIRVGLYTRELAIRSGLSDEEVHDYFLVGLLHDIGKIGIPDNILNKPGKLTSEEYDVIKKHVQIGDDIIDNYRMLSGFKDGVVYHHEKWDGSGYASNLKGEDIPLIARYIAIADTYDAMSSDRVYRKALSEDVIIDEFIKYRGIQFDPRLCDEFLELIKDGSLSKYHGETDYIYVTDDEKIRKL